MATQHHKVDNIIHADFRQSQTFDLRAFVRERGVKLEEALKRADRDDVRVTVTVGDLRGMLEAHHGH